MTLLGLLEPPFDPVGILSRYSSQASMLTKYTQCTTDCNEKEGLRKNHVTLSFSLLFMHSAPEREWSKSHILACLPLTNTVFFPWQQRVLKPRCLPIFFLSRAERKEEAEFSLSWVLRGDSSLSQEDINAFCKEQRINIPTFYTVCEVLQKWAVWLGGC